MSKINFSHKKIGAISLGCDKNTVETEKILFAFQNKGFVITNSISEANVVVINTCAFLESSRKEGIETILNSAEYKSGVLEKLVVVGCLPQKYISELYDSLEEVDVFAGICDYDKIVKGVIDSYESGKRVNLAGDFRKSEKCDRILSTYPYAYLKIADGCNNCCSYCLIPQIRGKFRSTPMGELLDEASKLNAEEIILVAQDVTSYGEDLYGENKLVELIRGLAKIDDIKKIRLLYCYPEKITDELINEFKTNEKLVKYIDIPFQHASNKVLKLMNRRGDKESYIALIKKLRKEVKGIAIRSTFIVGFSGEGEKEFDELIGFLKEVKLENAGFFAYSNEKEAPSYKLKERVKAPEKRKRLKIAYKVQREISRETLRGFIGKKIKVTVMGVDFDKGFYGRAYFEAPDIDGVVYLTKKGDICQGDEVEVLIKKTNDYDLYGVIL